MAIYNRLPEIFECGEMLGYVVAHPDGTLFSLEGLNGGRILLVLEVASLPADAEDYIRSQLDDLYDEEKISFVLMSQRTIEELIDAHQELVGYEFFTGDPTQPQLSFDKYYFPADPE